MKTIITSLDNIHKFLPIEAKAIFVMPFIDYQEASKACKIFSVRANSTDGVLLAIHDIHRLGFVNVANEIYNLTSSELFGYFASDAFPSRRWLEFSLASFSNNDIGLLSYNDGKWFGRLAGFGLVKRSWLTDYYTNSLFFSDYKSHYGDTEISVLAHATYKLGYNANIVIMEVDYNKDTKSVNQNDKLIFQKRMRELRNLRTWENPSAFLMFK